MGCREKGDAKGRTVRKRAYSTICNSTWSKGYCDAFHNDPTLHCPKCNLTKTQHDARVSLPKGDPDRCKKRYWTRIPKGANLWECLKCNYWACSACYKKAQRSLRAEDRALRKALADRKKARRPGKAKQPKAKTRWDPAAHYRTTSGSRSAPREKKQEAGEERSVKTGGMWALG